MSSRYYLPMAKIEWQDEIPYSPEFGDIYWSKSGGEEEKKHVFLEANNLSTRWENLSKTSQFVIAETGFGFGLNFFLTIELWRSAPRAGAVLHYVAFEKHLVSLNDLERIGLDVDPQIFSEFQRQYPDPIPGPHYLWLAEDICLTLIIGDIADMAPSLCAEIDALFLDGFSPNKNEDMWTSKLYKTLILMMRPGATLSTYTVAGHVRRGLAEHGVNVSKSKGFGSKAEMLTGQVPGVWQQKNVTTDQVTIIGAGLAGLTCQSALARRGIPVRLIDAKPNQLGAVEQIPQLAISPQLSLSPTPQSRFSLLAFEYIKKNLNYQRCGKLNLLLNEDAAVKANKLVNLIDDSLARIVTPSEASQISGLVTEHAGLFFPDAGWIDPKQNFGSNDEIPSDKNDIHLSTIVSSVTKRNDGWLIACETDKTNQLNASNQVTAKSVVFATGSMATEMLAPLNLLPVRGQCLVTQTLDGSKLKTIVSGEVSVFPDNNGAQTISSTYRRNSDELNPDSQDTAWLRDRFDSLLPNTARTLASVNAEDESASFVGIRATTRDRTPVLGRLPDWQKLQAYCDRAQTGKRSKNTEKVMRNENFTDYQTGLYAMTGFGSHGLTQGPLCAEILARMINQEPHLTPDYLAPIRFALRDAGIKVRH